MALTYFVRMKAREGQEQAVHDVLLSNADRIRATKDGNLAFAVHRCRQYPREFWLYETWTDEDAAARHESGEAFKAYKERLHPLVETDSVLFGDTEPLAVLGYDPPVKGPTLAQQFVQALAANDRPLLEAIYDRDVVLYTPLGWPIRGLEAVRSSSASSTPPIPVCA